MPYKEEEIGKALVRARLITQEDLQPLLDLTKSGKSLAKLLVQKGFVTEGQITKAMELCFRVPYVNLKEHGVEPDALKLIPHHVAQEYQVIPMTLKDNLLTVAMADPEDVMAVDYLQNFTGCKIRVVFSEPSAIKEAVHERYEKKEKSAVTVVLSKEAPSPVGPYSQALAFRNLIFLSGQIGINAAAEFAGPAIEAQTKQALENLKAVLKSAGSDLSKVLKTTIFLANMEDYKTVNEIYAGYFTSNPPARSAVAVKSLPKGALVEIEAIAYKEE